MKMRIPKCKTGNRFSPSAPGGAFTLVEILVTTVIIAILAALLLPTFARGKLQAQSAACKNHLKQIGIALKMYASDFGWYPPMAERDRPELCFDRLYPYYPLNWTSVSWNCPVYVARGGVISPQLVSNNSCGISYSYNWLGIGAGAKGAPPLGLGHLPKIRGCCESCCK